MIMTDLADVANKGCPVSHNRNHPQYKSQITNIILQNNFGVSIKLCNLSKFLLNHLIEIFLEVVRKEEI